MSGIGIQPAIDPVSLLEAQRSGIVTESKRALNDNEVSRVKSFGDRYAGRYRPPPPSKNDLQSPTKVTPQQTSADAQVSAEELALANASRGIARVSSGLFRSRNGSKALYQLLYSSDDLVFDSELHYLIDAVKRKAKTRADMDLNIDQHQRDLRNFLLADYALSDDFDLPKADIRALQLYGENLLKPSGAYIRQMQAAFAAGEEIGLVGVQLRDVVKAYQSSELTQFNETPDLLSLFRMVKKNVVGENYIREIKRMQRRFGLLIKRDKAVPLSGASGPRQAIMISMLSKLDLIAKTYILHQKFLACCSKSGMKGLPTLSNLMEFCLQTISGADVLGGTNGLIRLASLVTARLIPARNIFMANYNRMVMQSSLLAPHYKNHTARKQIGESLEKSMKATGVLAAKVREYAD